MRYEQPNVEVISLEAEDIVTISGEGVGGNNGEFFPKADAVSF